jgi:hypothetical protein
MLDPGASVLFHKGCLLDTISRKTIWPKHGARLGIATRYGIGAFLRNMTGGHQVNITIARFRLWHGWGAC